MQILRPKAERAAAMVQAMRAVVTANGSVAASSRELAAIDAIQRDLLGSNVNLAEVPSALPIDLARRIRDPDLGLMLVRLLILLPAIQPELRADKVAVVVAAADQLCFARDELTYLLHACRRDTYHVRTEVFRNLLFDYVTPDPSAPRIWELARFALNSKYKLPNRTLAERFRSLKDLPANSLGNNLYNYYLSNQLPLPGEWKSIANWFISHDLCHVLAGYPATPRGEMLVTGFIGGNMAKRPAPMILAALLQYHVGMRVNARPQRDLFVADKFFEAVARGAATGIDLMESDWDWWSMRDRPIAEVRKQLRIRPLRASKNGGSIVPGSCQGTTA